MRKLVILGILFATVAYAQSPGGPPPNLTQEQKACLENILGVPGQGAPPERSVAEAAFKTCGVRPPPPPPSSSQQSPPPSGGGAQ